MGAGLWGRSLGSLFPNARIGLSHHLFAEVNADKVLLKNIVVEHVFRRFAQIDDPFTQMRRPDTVSHILSIAGAGGVIIAADAAHSARNEMSGPRIPGLHKTAVAAKDRWRAVTLGGLALAEVDFGIDSQTADDSSNRVPCHFDEIGVRLCLGHDLALLYSHWLPCAQT